VPFIVQKIAGQQSMISFVPGDRLRIGRGTNAELRFDDVAVGLEHAVIEAVAGGYRLLDRGSVTGTYLNGRAVREAQLATNDLISIGSYEIRAQITDSEDPLFLAVRVGAGLQAPPAATTVAPPSVIAAAVQAAAAQVAAEQAAAGQAAAGEVAAEPAGVSQAVVGPAVVQPAPPAVPAAAPPGASPAVAPIGARAWEADSGDAVTAADAATMRMSPEALAAAVRAATAMAAAAARQSAKGAATGAAANLAGGPPATDEAKPRSSGAAPGAAAPDAPRTVAEQLAALEAVARRPAGREAAPVVAAASEASTRDAASREAAARDAAGREEAAREEAAGDAAAREAAARVAAARTAADGEVAAWESAARGVTGEIPVAGTAAGVPTGWDAASRDREAVRSAPPAGPPPSAPLAEPAAPGGTLPPSTVAPSAPPPAGPPSTPPPGPPPSAPPAGPPPSAPPAGLPPSASAGPPPASSPPSRPPRSAGPRVPPPLPTPAVDYLHAYGLRRSFFNKGLLALGLTVGAAALMVALPLTGRTRAFEPGPVHAWHSDTSCASCHSPWRGPDPALCADCHSRQREKGQVHQASQTFTPPCTGCHPEHRGGERAVVGDRTCVSCHGDLQVNPPGAEPRFARRVRGFADDHPDFSVTLPSGARMVLAEAVARRVDPTPLRFNHRQHLRAGLPTPSGQRVQLTCQSCHRLQAGNRQAAPGTPPAPSAGKAAPLGNQDAAGQNAPTGSTGIVPVTYDATCTTSGCHPLTFDSRRPDQVAPHAAPRRVREFLISVYSDRRAANESVRDQYLRLIRGAGQQSRAIDYSAQAQGAEVLAERYLYGTACKECHFVDANARPVPAVTWQPIPERWLPNARFSHLDHQASDCQLCHGTAAASTVTADVLLPSIAVCRTCHGGTGSIGNAGGGTGPGAVVPAANPAPASSTGSASPASAVAPAAPAGPAPVACLSCHRYHPDTPPGPDSAGSMR
jgi:hypothetical protein